MEATNQRVVRSRGMSARSADAFSEVHAMVNGRKYRWAKQNAPAWRLEKALVPQRLGVIAVELERSYLKRVSVDFSMHGNARVLTGVSVIPGKLTSSSL